MKKRNRQISESQEKTPSTLLLKQLLKELAQKEIWEQSWELPGPR